ncbi:endonuclease/exonuclease/phosphatase family protein [Sediminitomix flava]|uniref:Endonuclease/Exonuclease/phosphatase family protein n=1 Tax=Sediminitomix flava TaxID=379075 RepID=A0A315ZD74_SEDFL|nr:hypothetical protein [Sediminitomix flava]PWJ43063.1 Endonuclease/Exonuclease/phosphatase family protein [Sediminitomix flava]
MKKLLHFYIPFLLFITSISCIQASTPVSYTLVEADYEMVGDGYYDNFSFNSELDSIWVRQKIAFILDARFDSAQDGDRVEVSYKYYEGGVKQKNEIFQYSDTEWTSEQGSHEIPMLGEGEDVGVKVVTWNVEWLGAEDKSRSTDSKEWQLRATASQILRMDADIYALQEVVVDGIRGDNLQLLLDRLNDKSEIQWAGFYSARHSFSWKGDDEDFPAQKTAFVYKTENVSLKKSYNLFEENFISDSEYELPNYDGSGHSFMSSGRLPLVMEADVTVDGVTKELVLVNLHFKCCSNGTERRQADANYLYNKLQEKYPTNNVIILGDYNNATYNGAEGPKRWGWYEEQAYFYAGGQNDGIDHFSISDELLDEFVSVESPYFTESEVGNISDHDPQLLLLSMNETVQKIGYFSSSTKAGNETEETEVAYVVRLHSVQDENVSVPLEITGEGLADADYTLSKESFEITQGVLSDTIFLTIQRDDEVEGTEKWTASVSSEDVLFYGENSQVLTVEDLPQIKVSLSSLELEEGKDDQLKLLLESTQYVRTEIGFTFEIPFKEDFGLSLSQDSVFIKKNNKKAEVIITLTDDNEIEEEATAEITVRAISDLQYMEGDLTFELVLKDNDKEEDKITGIDLRDADEFTFSISNNQLFVESLSKTRGLMNVVLYYLNAQKVLERELDLAPKQRVLVSEKELQNDQVYIIKYELNGEVRSLKIKA